MYTQIFIFFPSLCSFCKFFIPFRFVDVIAVAAWLTVCVCACMVREWGLLCDICMYMPTFAYVLYVSIEIWRLGLENSMASNKIGKMLRYADIDVCVSVSALCSIGRRTDLNNASKCAMFGNRRKGEEGVANMSRDGIGNSSLFRNANERILN